ncbi:MAG: cytochrome c553 [Rhodothermales bacterium]|jgi:cytochrome c553
MKRHTNPRACLCYAAACFFAMTLAIVAEEDPGAVEFAANCVACHTATGHGNVAVKAPSIAGLSSWYVAYQLRRFRDGIRGTHVKDESGKLMRHVAGLLNEDQIVALARHVSLLPVNPKRKTLEGGSPARGKQLFRETCMPCHRFDASGEKVFRSAPLTSQQDWYLLAQLEKFKQHQRGIAKGDDLGPKMHEVSGELDLKTDALDIVAYITSLPVRVDTRR